MDFIFGRIGGKQNHWKRGEGADRETKRERERERWREERERGREREVDREYSVSYWSFFLS